MFCSVKRLSYLFFILLCAWLLSGGLAQAQTVPRFHYDAQSPSQKLGTFSSELFKITALPGGDYQVKSEKQSMLYFMILIDKNPSVAEKWSFKELNKTPMGEVSFEHEFKDFMPAGQIMINSNIQALRVKSMKLTKNALYFDIKPYSEHSHMVLQQGPGYLTINLTCLRYNMTCFIGPCRFEVGSYPGCLKASGLYRATSSS